MQRRMELAAIQTQALSECEEKHTEHRWAETRALFLSSHSVVSSSLRPHGLQHTRLPCPSLSPKVCSNSCPLSQWCCLTISSSAALFSFCLQSFPASGSFPVSWLFTSHGQTLELQLQHQFFQWIFIQDWFPLGLTFLISLQSKGLLRVFSSTTVKSINYLVLSLLYGPTLTSIHDYWKDHGFDYMDLCQQSDILAFYYAV